MFLLCFMSLFFALAATGKWLASRHAVISVHLQQSASVGQCSSRHIAFSSKAPALANAAHATLTNQTQLHAPLTSRTQLQLTPQSSRLHVDFPAHREEAILFSSPLLHLLHDLIRHHSDVPPPVRMDRQLFILKIP